MSFSHLLQKNHLAAVIAASASLFAGAALAQVASPPRTAGTFYWGKVNTPAVQELAASFQLVVVGLSPSAGIASMQADISAIRALNPSIKIAQYLTLYGLQGTALPGESVYASVQAANAGDWWLRDALGQRVAFGNPGIYEINSTVWAAADISGRRWPQWKAQSDTTNFFTGLTGIDYVFSAMAVDNPGPATGDWRRIGTNQSRTEPVVSAAFRQGVASQPVYGRHQSISEKCRVAAK